MELINSLVVNRDQGPLPIRSRLPTRTIIYPLFPVGDRRAERRKICVFIRLSYTPISVASLGVDSSPRLFSAYFLSSCFPVPASQVLCPCLDCVYYTPSSSYFTSTSCFCRVCRLARLCCQIRRPYRMTHPPSTSALMLEAELQA